MKLKFQDNFEFLQWLKGFYDLESSGEYYDATARRNGQMVDSGGASAPRAGSSYSSARNSSAAPSRIVQTRSGASVSSIPGRTGSSLNRSAGGAPANSAALAEANKQIIELKNLLSTSEKEREYYYNKLRLVESLVQTTEAEEGTEIFTLLSQIQKYLYSDEETYYEENAEGTDPGYLEAYDNMNNLKIDEEETF
ncbi:Microtubule-associated protein RP/EB family member 1 [Smittium mucronatum]|uniref:Microtubule-associated protein RP/EB family member 1 n=1 Tax=Smittium mucronatum TaxID=133383 RepID=A0A1R0GM15_9FUNG|nr:Microtubule-associated protein RP/EB family member 1 [Smittium mucronatum]